MKRESAPRDATDSTRGQGPWKRKWYSICSNHRNFQPDCPRCREGHWVNNWSHAVDHAFYRAAPDLWRVWTNRSRGWRNAWKNRKV